MTRVRIALANLPFPGTLEQALEATVGAIAQAASMDAAIVCFPECFVPGYRAPGKQVSRTSPAALQRAWSAVASAAAGAGIWVVLGTERIVADDRYISALVIDAEGTIVGHQDKVQLDPSEEATYVAGCGRQLFHLGALTFGIVICHEGWRYPETVRWAARRGAQLVFHPHFHEAEPDGFRPTRFADPDNTFHEKAVLCRAAENTIYVATVNCASPGSPTTSAIVRPDGSLQTYQPYGRAGLLVADIDLASATGLLAARYRGE